MEFYSWDLLGKQLYKIPFSTWRITEALNLPGGFSCDINTSSSKAGAAFLGPGRHAIFFDDAKTLRYGGIGWQRQYSQNLETLTFGGQGFISAFRDGKRNLRADYPPAGFSATGDQFQHVSLLMAIAQSDAGGDLGITVRYPALSGVPRSLTIKGTERKSYGQVIEDMASADDGFDFAITPEWHSGIPKVFLDLFYPDRGTVLPTVWQLGSHVTLASDWEQSVAPNRFEAVGGAVGGEPVIETASNPAVDEIRIDELLSFSDITDPDVLLGLAKGARRAAKSPSGPIKVQVQNFKQCGFGTWGLGDTITLVANLRCERIADPYRIVGYEAAGDDKDALKLTISLEPA